ncbi:MAG: inositol monophosphatase [Patescibacteria group bacterium]|jgi:histidinol-phosphatase
MKAYKKELEVCFSLVPYLHRTLLRHYKRGVRGLAYKPNGSEVTATDHALERTVTKVLRQHFPKDQINGEEFGVTGGNSKRVWVIDPLDGTAQFVAGTGNFCSMIGLVENGQPVLGFIHLPNSNETYYATRGGGAYMRKRGVTRKLALRQVPDIEVARFSGPSDWNKATILRQKVAKAIGLPQSHYRAIGSIGVEHCMVASHQLDVVLTTHPQLGPWDVVPCEVIITEAGGTVTDLSGKVVRPNGTARVYNRGILSTSTIVHKQILKRLRKAGYKQ